MTAVLNWALEHWFPIFLTAIGVFETIRALREEGI